MQFFWVSTKIFDAVLDLMLGTIWEVDGSDFGDVSTRKGDNYLQEPIFYFRELGLGLESFLDDGDEERVEKRHMVLQDLDSLLPSHHDGVIAEKLLLGYSAVYVKQ